MTPIRSLEQTLFDNLPWNKARIKFVTRFLLALFSQRTVNLARLATAFAGHASEASNYKRLQRFLHSFAIPYAQVAHFVVQLLGEPGPYTLALDRTNWQVGSVEINILLLSLVWRGIGFPLVWFVLPHAGNSDTTERMTLLTIFIEPSGCAIETICFSNGVSGGYVFSNIAPPPEGTPPASLLLSCASSSFSSLIIRALGSSLTTAWFLILLAESAYRRVLKVSS